MSLKQSKLSAPSIPTYSEVFINERLNTQKNPSCTLTCKASPNMLRELTVNDYQDTLLTESTNGTETLLDNRLCLPTQKGFIIIKLEDIIYCEAQRSYTNFRFADNKRIMISKPLFDYDKLLSDAMFLRIHRSFLINLMHVKEYVRGEGGTVVMTNGMEIEVSRRKKELFISRIRECFKTV